MRQGRACQKKINHLRSSDELEDGHRGESRPSDESRNWLQDLECRSVGIHYTGEEYSSAYSKI